MAEAERDPLSTELSLACSSPSSPRIIVVPGKGCTWGSAFSRGLKASSPELQIRITRTSSNGKSSLVTENDMVHTRIAGECGGAAVLAGLREEGANACLRLAERQRVAGLVLLFSKKTTSSFVDDEKAARAEAATTAATPPPTLTPTPATATATSSATDTMPIRTNERAGGEGAEEREESGKLDVKQRPLPPTAAALTPWNYSRIVGNVVGGARTGCMAAGCLDGSNTRGVSGGGRDKGFILILYCAENGDGDDNTRDEEAVMALAAGLRTAAHAIAAAGGAPPEVRCELVPKKTTVPHTLAGDNDCRQQQQQQQQQPHEQQDFLSFPPSVFATIAHACLQDQSKDSRGGENITPLPPAASTAASTPTGTADDPESEAGAGAAAAAAAREEAHPSTATANSCPCPFLDWLPSELAVRVVLDAVSVLRASPNSSSSSPISTGPPPSSLPSTPPPPTPTFPTASPTSPSLTPSPPTSLAAAASRRPHHQQHPPLWRREALRSVASLRATCRCLKAHADAVADTATFAPLFLGTLEEVYGDGGGSRSGNGDNGRGGGGGRQQERPPSLSSWQPKWAHPELGLELCFPHVDFSHLFLLSRHCSHNNSSNKSNSNSNNQGGVEGEEGTSSHRRRNHFSYFFGPCLLPPQPGRGQSFLEAAKHAVQHFTPLQAVLRRYRRARFQGGWEAVSKQAFVDHARCETFTNWRLPPQRPPLELFSDLTAAAAHDLTPHDAPREIPPGLPNSLENELLQQPIPQQQRQRQPKQEEPTCPFAGIALLAVVEALQGPPPALGDESSRSSSSSGDDASSIEPGGGAHATTRVAIGAVRATHDDSTAKDAEAATTTTNGSRSGVPGSGGGGGDRSGSSFPQVILNYSAADLLDNLDLPADFDQWWCYHDLAVAVAALFFVGASHPRYAARLQPPRPRDGEEATEGATGEAAVALGLPPALCNPHRLAEALLVKVVEGWTVRGPPPLTTSATAGMTASAKAAMTRRWVATVKPPLWPKGHRSTVAVAAFLLSLSRRVDCYAACVLLLEGPQRACLSEELAERVAQDTEAAFDVFFQRGHVLH